jgi:hypothetical protein
LAWSFWTPAAVAGFVYPTDPVFGSAALSGAALLSLLTFGGALRSTARRKAGLSRARRIPQHFAPEAAHTPTPWRSVEIPNASASKPFSSREFVEQSFQGIFTGETTVVTQGWGRSHVVDCGSGSTRAICFTENSTGQEIDRSKSDWRGDALALALQDDARVQGLLELLDEQIPEGPVLLGATAGVRHAINQGDLAQPQLKSFEQRLQDHLGSRAQFAVLSGEEEALAEWEAVQYELSVRSGLAPKECAGMVSGGGMSCQVALRADGDTAPQAFSFENFVLVPGGLVDRAGRGELQVSELFEGLATCRARTSAALQGHRRLEGTFAMIEWVGNYVGDNRPPRDLGLGLGHERLLSHAEVVNALDLHLSSLTPPPGSGGEAPVPRSTAVALTYGTVLKTLLTESFSEGALFYCLAGVNWATGHYLMTRQGC